MPSVRRLRRTSGGGLRAQAEGPREPLRLVGAVTDRGGPSPEQLGAMRDGLEERKRSGRETIDD